MLKKIKGLLFENTSTRQTVAKNTFWLTVSNFGGRMIRSIIIVYAARVLGASEWGTFSYAVALSAFITIFTDLGIGPILVRETAKARENPEERRAILSAAFFVKAALLLLGSIIIVFVAPHFTADETVKTLLPIVAFIFVFDTIREFCFSLIRAMEKMEWEVGLFFLTNVAIVVFGFIFLAWKPNVVFFTYAYAAGTAVGMIATLYKMRGHFRGILSRFDTRLAKYIFYSGWPFAVSAILGVLMVDTDILLIGWFKSSTDVGVYSASLRIIQLFYIIPSTLAVSILPTFSRLAQRDGARFKSALENALWLMYLIAIPLAIGGVILGKEVIGLIFGTEYLGGTIPFKILMLTMLINFPVTILSGVIFAHNKQRSLMAYAVIGGVTNAVLDIIFIPRYGIIGSAIVTFMAQLAGNIYLWRVMRSVVKPSVIPRLKNILPATIVMAAFAFGLNTLGLPVLVTIAASVLVYFGMLLTLREPVIKEVRLILQPSALVSPEKSE